MDLGCGYGHLLYGFKNYNQQQYKVIGVDYDFINAYGLKLIAGRNFSKGFGSDDKAVIFNRKGIEQLGFFDGAWWLDAGGPVDHRDHFRCDAGAQADVDLRDGDLGGGGGCLGIDPARGHHHGPEGLDYGYHHHYECTCISHVSPLESMPSGVGKIVIPGPVQARYVE